VNKNKPRIAFEVSQDQERLMDEEQLDDEEYVSSEDNLSDLLEN
ncbi:965_t:CDS:1, partial [Cetraspora pellucida]